MRCKALIILLIAVLLVACSLNDQWQPVDGSDSLLNSNTWHCYSGLEARDGNIVISSGEDYKVFVHHYGPTLRINGDFGIATTISAENEGLASISLIGVRSKGDWWNGVQKIDVGIGAGSIVVNIFNGESFMPAVSETFEADDLVGSVQLHLRRINDEFVILANQTEVGRINDPGVFPNNIVTFGASMVSNNALTIHELIVEAPPGQPDAVIINSPSDNTAYSNPTPPLRDLADAHGIYIGGAVAPVPLRCEQAYGEVLGREFNIVTTENALKFGPVHPEPDRYNFADADAIVSFAEAHDMLVRGHTLLWHNQAPNWINTAEFSQEQWNQVVQEHITTVVGRYRGRVQIWDVVNEALDESGPDGFRETVWYEGVGPDYIDKAFRWAHEADPDALLFYNDYGAEGLNGKSQQVYELVKGMLERGVPIHGVGLQMHANLGDYPKPEEVLQNMNRLADLGLQVHITELDIRLSVDPSQNQLNRQATIYQRMMETCLEAKQCTAFIMWGFTDRYSWIPNTYPDADEALIFDRQYTPKPAYYALRKALRTEAKSQGPEDFGADCNCGP